MKKIYTKPLLATRPMTLGVFGSYGDDNDTVNRQVHRSGKYRHMD